MTEPYTVEDALRDTKTAVLRLDLLRVLKWTFWFTLGTLAAYLLYHYNPPILAPLNNPHVAGRVLLGIILVVFFGGGALIWRNRR